jgi:hypothetical protein
MAILVLDVAKEVYQTLLAITATQADLMAPFTKQELWQVSSMRGDCAPRPRRLHSSLPRNWTVPLMT